jgi:mannan endo-1,4-beta-mannosidase
MTRLPALLILLLSSFFAAAQKPIDLKATKETRTLYKNLYALSKNHILFGHQHATEYGHGWQDEENRSDVKSVTGSHPAVIGVDFSGLTNIYLSENARKKTAAFLRKTISDTYNRGGITTIAWHFTNPTSGGGFYWNDSVSKPAVRLLMTGGSHHEQYKAILKTIADFVLSVKGNDGKMVPMIFRPYHEFDGDWFWWGKAHCTREEFITLWRFTVSYLRDSMNVHQFIYAFSPDNKFLSEKEYLDRYPGDAWVDMLGTDNYGDFGRDGRYKLEAGLKKLQIISEYAKKAKKLAAFTETGLESTPNTTWWTQTLLPILKTKGMRLAYVLVWRNDARSATHFYAPFPGHSSAPDFIKFYKDPFTLFENDLKKMYQ